MIADHQSNETGDLGSDDIIRRASTKSPPITSVMARVMTSAAMSWPLVDLPERLFELGEQRPDPLDLTSGRGDLHSAEHTEAASSSASHPPARTGPSAQGPGPSPQ